MTLRRSQSQRYPAVPDAGACSADRKRWKLMVKLVLVGFDCRQHFRFGRKISEQQSKFARPGIPRPATAPGRLPLSSRLLASDCAEQDRFITAFRTEHGSYMRVPETCLRRAAYHNGPNQFQMSEQDSRRRERLRQRQTGSIRPPFTGPKGQYTDGHDGDRKKYTRSKTLLWTELKEAGPPTFPMRTPPEPSHVGKDVSLGLEAVFAKACVHMRLAHHRRQHGETSASISR